MSEQPLNDQQIVEVGVFGQQSILSALGDLLGEGGQAMARTVKLLPDGTVFYARAQKIRRLEQGYEYAAAQLCAFGAPRPRPGSDPVIWLREALAAAPHRRCPGGCACAPGGQAGHPWRRGAAERFPVKSGCLVAIPHLTPDVGC
ncbi:hypothetical protein [Streptomyces mirabilis]|uniref:hypothetical protein n=1 Tax=Streptomyces mirabilis TaxID=68239 RepID=UPI0036B82098